MAIDTTRQLINQIRNASQIGENTATRVGDAMEAILDDAIEQGGTPELKTVNGQSLIGEGNIQIGSQGTINIDATVIPDSPNAVSGGGVKTYVDGVVGVVLVSGTPLAQQMTTANTTYIVKSAINMVGASVTVPSGSTIKFENGGRISNGTLTGDDTVIDTNEGLQCTLAGTFVAREGVINATNMANALAHIKTPVFRVVADMTLSNGFDTTTIADTTIDGQGHTLTIPSLSISTQGNNITIKDCTINTSETRVISVDAFCFGLVDSVGGSIAMLQNVGFVSLVGSVYLRGYNDAIIEDCSLVGATASAGSRKGAAILLDNQSVHVSGCTFSGLAKATHIMGGTSADKASEINNNTVTDCDGGFISNGGIVNNYSIVRNTLRNVGQTGGAEKSNINIHGMDLGITVTNNSIIDFIGSPLDLDSSLSGVPNPNTNPHLLVSGNTIVGSLTYGNLLIWQIKDAVFSNNIVKNIAKIVTRNCKNLTIKDNVLTADGFVESSYTIADTYNLYLIDNVLAMNPANAIAASVQFTADNTTVNAEFLRNTKYATGGKPFVYNTVTASSVRILKANTDWNSYTTFLPQTQPTTLDQFYTRADAYTKLSFNLSAAASESAFTFFVWLGIYVNNSAKIVTIAMQANGVPRLQSIYADNIVFKFYYGWDATTKIFDLYIIRGAQFLARGWVMLTVPNQGRNYDVPVTRSSTTVAIAETKTALTNASYIEMMAASELASASNNAISYSINEGFFAKAAGYVYNYLGLRANKLIGATADRPTGLGTAEKGYQFFDTTLNLPIWWNGSAWVKSDGTTA